ncbi:hypothetical protein FGSG_00230 [Fusarium graminearum PH-1]|uniref:Chromosome 1, complete genome n=1 Tax=Gibberella zeae (strain ATCC MYA-4620 / CBS 123657 / FGSC 9075 / NRRL 31084 / PH-1) TaxID=229533 RepID=I1R9S3_GIBZE|nr:hypothetical protein FGSG_00230 [Fusarium graminearum PH-1]ESU05371.1 hypothetical protein FGSG_00230 [Fusarium graminearum PH-1]CAF3573540.1 unnamed protein product [Fusarium graminearum]CAF3600595.1 unnamed protein product [Fusarium graminearum]CEF72108.1 unnamed protein product [Fusarium graminearum]|eukprot:XP_011315856.1 hypothetical protein FGSG_00230 [Fusarium graminearum PH-1]
MHFSSILPIVAVIAGFASANPTPDEPVLETRTDGGIELIELDLGKGKSYTGVGRPGKCYNLPWNIKSFHAYSDDTKSVISCFDCRVYTKSNCGGSYVSLGGQQKAFMEKGGKKPQYKSWKCKCKEEW